MGLMLDVVPFMPKSTNALIADNSDEEIKVKLEALRDEVTFDSWEKVEKSYNKKVTTKNKGTGNTKNNAKGLGKKTIKVTVTHTKMVTRTMSKEDFI